MAAAGKPALPSPAAWPLFLRDAARRPASWLAAGMACGAAGAPRPLEAMAVAALAAVAAAGDPPAAGTTRSTGGWIGARMVWPLAGLGVGAATGLLGYDDASSTPIIARAAAACAALMMMAVTLWAGRRSGASSVDTASIAMVTATAALVVGGVADSWPVAVATWVALAPGGPWVLRWLDGHDDGRLPRGGGDMVGGLISRTRVRRLLGRTAMMAMLLAMVGWLVLDPSQARRAAALGVAWMVCLALPAAVLRDGVVDGEGSPWVAVWQSTPRRWPALGWCGIDTRMPIETVVRHAAVLGWPSLVAAVVAVNTPTGPRPGLFVAAAIVATAGGILLTVLICRALTLSRETAFATVLALVAWALLVLPTASGAILRHSAWTCQTFGAVMVRRGPSRSVGNVSRSMSRIPCGRFDTSYVCR